MKIAIILTILCLCAQLNAQSYFDSASTPADNGANATTDVAITPPASMTSGMLVVLIGQVLTASASITINEPAGQIWYDAGLSIGGTNHSAKVFWCRFNGTWNGDPEINFSANNATSAIMHVFIPSGSNSDNRTWALDQAGATDTYTAPANPFAVNRAGQTNVNAKAVVLAMFFSIDDNTWSYSTGNYNLVGSAQYRNTADNDMSCMFAAQYFPFAGSNSANGRYNQATNGGDDGATAILTWYDYPVGSGIPFYYLKH